MVIIDYKAGQLANRLFHFSYFIANSLENNYYIINPHFDDYKMYFDSTSKNYFFNKKISTCFSRYFKVELLIKKTIEVLRIYTTSNKIYLSLFFFHDITINYDHIYKEYDITSQDFQNLAQKKIVFTKGWNYRDLDALCKHAVFIRKLFTPKDCYLNKVKESIYKLKKDFDIVIGVHIRRGDYREFFNGRWYFNDDIYISKMKELQKIFHNNGKSICFTICSNEFVDNSKYLGVDLSIQNGDEIHDLYLLSRCDLIMGPPSTFSMWASFFGQRPLLMIKSIDTLVKIENFKVYNNIESFF